MSIKNIKYQLSRTVFFCYVLCYIVSVFIVLFNAKKESSCLLTFGLAVDVWVFLLTFCHTTETTGKKNQTSIQTTKIFVCIEHKLSTQAYYSKRKLYMYKCMFISMCAYKVICKHYSSSC